VNLIVSVDGEMYQKGDCFNTKTQMKPFNAIIAAAVIGTFIFIFSMRWHRLLLRK